MALAEKEISDRTADRAAEKAENEATIKDAEDAQSAAAKLFRASFRKFQPMSFNFFKYVPHSKYAPFVAYLKSPMTFMIS